MFKKIKYIVLILMCSVATISATAQRDTSLTQEVEVVKSFRPTISDANKINEMPKIDETKPEKPTFNYSIYSQPILNTFSVNTLKAASIAGEPRKDNGYGLIRAGLGNYNKPYGELFFNNLNSKKSIFGLHAKHLSSFGKLKLEGGDVVDAPISDSEAEIYLNYFFRQSVLALTADVDHNGFNYYGYPETAIPPFLMDPGQLINYQNQKQAFTKGGFQLNLSTPDAEIDDPLFGFNADYHYFRTKTGQDEHSSKLSTTIQKPMETGTVLLEAGVSFSAADGIFNRATELVGQRQQTWIFAKPAYYLGGKMADIKFGFNSWLVADSDYKTKIKVTPNVLAHFRPVKNIFELYAGIDGNYINNHYSKIAYENPFVNPMHDVANSFEKLHIYGGLDGKFTKKTNFKFAVDYSVIDDKPLYFLHGYTHPDPAQNPDPFVVDNDFKVMYDNMSLLKFNMEIFHASSEKLDLLITGNYYVYDLKEQTTAWNLPDWDANLTVNYKITEQFNVSADVFLIGERNALMIETNYAYNDPLSVEENLPRMYSYALKPVFDFNVRGNYNITQQFSVFAQLNNFGFQQYERWLGYPVQSFNFLAGGSFSF